MEGTAAAGLVRPAEPAEAACLDLLGVRVSVIPLARAAEAVVRWAAARGNGIGPRYVCATSAHGIMEARRDPEFRRVLNRAALVVPDGMPLVWFGRLSGWREMERVYGPDLMLAVCQRAAPLGLSHFFYGGLPGVAEELAERLSGRFPGLKVAGTYCPPFRSLSPSELDRLAAEINATAPDIVWVGLSTPKQELWISQMQRRLERGVLLSVGAAFDFHTGRLKRAPAWMQRWSLEWLFRLSQEPGRLWRRYARNNPAFFCLAALQLLGLRSAVRAQDPASGRR